MTHLHMHKLMDYILHEVTKTRESGQKEYAHDKDEVFANFNRVANLLEEDRKKVLMTYMLKHVDGIAAYVKGHKSQREDVTGRITDCMVYLMLLWGMIEEENATFNRKEDESLDVCDVLKAINAQGGPVPMDRGLSQSNGIQSKNSMQKVRKKRSRIKKSQEMGTT